MFNLQAGKTQNNVYDDTANFKYSTIRHLNDLKAFRGYS